MKKLFIGIKALLFIWFLFFAHISYALPFSIVPNATLPQSVPLGGTVSASYIVTNNTVSTRSGNYVKWLPPNVTQSIAGPNACQTNFTLGSHNSSNDHCTLNLTISGAVNASDPDPHHHLFVCFPGGTTCAGPNSQLNVTVSAPALVSIVVTPANPSIPRKTTQQFTATGTYTDSSTQNLTSSVDWTSSNTSIATISSTGLATGVGAGTSVITGTSGSISGATILTVNPIVAYVANSSANTVSVCSINQSTGKFILCHDSGAGAVFSIPIDISINPADTRLYAPDFNNTAGTSVQACLVNSTTNALSDCANVDGDGSAVFSAPTYVAFNAFGTHAYVSNLITGTISLCSVNLDTGKFTGCASAGSGFSFPIELILTTGGTRAYVGNDASSTTISLCSVDTTTGDLTGCADSDGDGSAVFSGPAFIAFNATQTRMYVGNNNSGTGTTVTSCSVNLATGKLSNCQDSGAGPIFTSPASVRLNPSNTLAYVANQGGASVTQCSVNASTGLLSGCGNADGDGTAVFNAPTGIILK
jgi:6-phosphogluconolactonase (cycloisomerase 2 family)